MERDKRRAQIRGAEESLEERRAALEAAKAKLAAAEEAASRSSDNLGSLEAPRAFLDPPSPCPDPPSPCPVPSLALPRLLPTQARSRRPTHASPAGGLPRPGEARLTAAPPRGEQAASRQMDELHAREGARLKERAKAAGALREALYAETARLQAARQAEARLAADIAGAERLLRNSR